MAEKWHHCRACGEEGLTPDSELCPLCGVEEPVQICHACRLPIREQKPWQIIAQSNDAPGAANRFSFHKACYGAGKRSLYRRAYRPPDWRMTHDVRDSVEPLSRTRLLLGMGCLILGMGTVTWLIALSPRPEPLFSPAAWDEMARQTAPTAPWVRLWLYRRPHHVTFLQLVFTFTGIGLGLWFIRWGLSRPRALYLEGLHEREDRG